MALPLTKHKLLTYLALIAVIITLCVIGLGAFTRLIDAGLGCPDWPGCYGHLTVPTTLSAIHSAAIQYPATPLVAHKAWAEMIHRYLAGTLGIIILLLVVLAALNAAEYGFSFLLLAVLLLVSIVYQALLGMLTVTLKLMPVIVTQHLLGGMTLLSLLWLLYLKSRWRERVAQLPHVAWRPWLLLGLFLLVMQMALGAWTSTNYATLSCTSFPFCLAHHGFQVDFKHAFNLIDPLGINYDGGVLSAAARMTIHMTHRFGALIVACYWFLLGGMIFNEGDRRLQRFIVLIWSLLVIQIALGISNVLLQLPLAVAISHTLCAGLLLMSVLATNYYAWAKRRVLVTLISEEVPCQA